MSAKANHVEIGESNVFGGEILKIEEIDEIHCNVLEEHGDGPEIDRASVGFIDDTPDIWKVCRLARLNGSMNGSFDGMMGGIIDGILDDGIIEWIIEWIIEGIIEWIMQGNGLIDWMIDGIVGFWQQGFL